MERHSIMTISGWVDGEETIPEIQFEELESAMKKCDTIVISDGNRNYINFSVFQGRLVCSDGDIGGVTVGSSSAFA